MASKASIRANGASFNGDFFAFVRGPAGSCECAWSLRITVSTTGVLDPFELTNLVCVASE